MFGSVLLLGLLLAASYTDFRWRVISNRITYSGILAALAGAALTSLCEPLVNHAWWGFAGFPTAVGGCLTCGGLMVVCYLFFPGGVGGGDVKLMAMIGAFLGVYPGLEALLWTFVIAACAAVSMLVWRIGFWSLLGKFARYMFAAVRTGTRPAATDEDRRSLATELYLSPSALVAVMIARWSLL